MGTTDIEADKADRQQDRADALADKAARRAAAADAAQQRARDLAGRLPFGQPILLGHHCEPAMRRHAQRIHTAMDASVHAAAYAAETQRQAEVAAIGGAARYHPVTVANRVEHLTAQRVRITRQLDGHTRTLAVLPDGTRHVETSTAATGEHRDRLTDRLAAATGQLTYWEGIRAQQITTGAATGYGPSSIGAGDAVKIRGRWHQVVRANRKTVTVPSSLGQWTDTAPYHEITDHRPAPTVPARVTTAGTGTPEGTS